MLEQLDSVDDESSVLHLARHKPEITALIDAKGWSLSSVDLADGTLRFTVDDWVTTNEAPLCVLPDDTHGFVLDELSPDTEVEYAIRVRLHERTGANDVEAWLNNNGQNYRARTEVVLDLDDELGERPIK